MIIQESRMGWYRKSRPHAHAELVMEIIGDGQSVTDKVLEVINFPPYADPQIFAISYPKRIHNIRHRRIRREAYRIHHRWKAFKKRYPSNK